MRDREAFKGTGLSRLTLTRVWRAGLCNSPARPHCRSCDLLL